MADLNIIVPATDAQETKAREWYVRVSSEMSAPPPDLETYLRDMLIDHLTEAIKSQDLPDIQEIWDSLTDDQKTRIKAIVRE